MHMFILARISIIRYQRHPQPSNHFVFITFFQNIERLSLLWLVLLSSGRGSHFETCKTKMPSLVYN